MHAKMTPNEPPLFREKNTVHTKHAAVVHMYEYVRLPGFTELPTVMYGKYKH